MHSTPLLRPKKPSKTLFITILILGITKIPPDNQRLYKDDVIMEDAKCLADYGLTASTARAQTPATVGLAYR